MQADAFVVQLQGELDPSSVGIKAGNLARVREIGLSIPPGSVITRRVLSLFLEQTGLLPKAERLVDDNGLDDTARATKYEALCEEVLRSPIPQPMIEAVAPIAQTLLDESPYGVAVRSSGVHEDSAKASFAGVYDSFLGIRSEADLWLAVRRCWCASWAPSTVDYARRMGIRLAVDGMAVLLQQLIRADSAGVLFTADPRTGNPWRFVLHSAFGLARDGVGGHADADELALDWDSNRILEKRVVEKPAMLAATSMGIREVELPEKRRNEPSLADADAHRIARAARTLDRAFDCRVDVEWALADDELYVVQVRPIAALPEFFPHELTEEEAKQTWHRSDEVWYRTPPQDGRLVAPLFADVWALERWRRYAPPPLPTPWQGEERDFNGYRYSTPWVWRGFPDLEESEQWLMGQEPRLRAQWEAGKETLRRETREVDQALTRVRSSSDLISILLRVKQRAFDFNALSFGPAQFLGGCCDELLQHFLQQIGSAVRADALLEGVTSLWYERNRALQHLAREIDEEFVRESFLNLPLDRVQSFLMEQHPDCRFAARYEKLCWDFGMTPPSLARRGEKTGIFDEVQHLFTIRSVLIDAASDIEDAWSKSRKRAAACADEVRRELAGDAGQLTRFERLLDWTRYWAPTLDDRTLCVLLFTRLNEAVWRTGRALMEEGITETTDGVHLLTPADLQQIAESRQTQVSRALSQTRRREFEKNQRLTPPPFLGTKPASAQTPEPPAPTAVKPESCDGPVLSGRSMTPWSATGVARVANSLSDAALLASLAPETILVCDGSSISYWEDWTSLFLVVAGLVIVGQHGGMHHAIQIARECGIAFVHLPEAELSSLQDGRHIALDGAAGTVTLLENKKSER